MILVKEPAILSNEQLFKLIVIEAINGAGIKFYPKFCTESVERQLICSSCLPRFNRTRLKRIIRNRISLIKF